MIIETALIGTITTTTIAFQQLPPATREEIVKGMTILAKTFCAGTNALLAYTFSCCMQDGYPDNAAFSGEQQNLPDFPSE